MRKINSKKPKQINAMKLILLILIILPFNFTLIGQIGTSTKLKEFELLDLASKFQGNWISESYIHKMTTSRSPYQAQEESFEVIYIDTSFIINGYFGISIYTYGDTEMLPITYFKKTKENEFLLSHVKFENDLLDDTCKIACDRLIFLDNNGQKSIRLTTKDGESDFIQLERTCDDSHLCEIDEYANKVFLQGNYILMDGKNNVLAPNFEINEKGLTKGYEDIEKLQIWTYFREGNGLFETDIVQIGERTSNSLNFYQEIPENVFLIEITDNEIKLYSLGINMDEYLVVKKELKYFLKKK